MDRGRIQRADVTDDAVILELFTGAPAAEAEGASRRRWLALRPGRGPLAEEMDARPPKEGPPPAAQKVLRAEVVPGALLELEEGPGWLKALVEKKGGKRRSLFVEADLLDPRVILCAEKGGVAKVLGVMVGAKRAKDGRDLRKGRRYELPQSPLLPSSAREASAEHEGSRGAAPPGSEAASEGAGAGASRRDDDPRAGLAAVRPRLKAERRRLRRLHDKLRGDLEKHGDPETLSRQGDALKTRLSAVQRGMNEVVGTGPDGEAVVVPLDPRRAPTENLANLYKRARRARRAREQAAPRLDEVQGRLAALEEAGARAARSDLDDEEATELAQELWALLAQRSSGGALRARPRSGTARRRPYRSFLCHGEVEVLVGRTAKDNDELTFHVSKGLDTWMHCRDAPGSHVIIPLPPARLDPELLVDAAHLAAWFSEKRGEARVDVQYTERKHVRKPGKGAAAGVVNLSDERVMHLAVDEERTRRLLSAETAPTRGSAPASSVNS